MSKTSHCVCSPFSTMDPSLKHVCDEIPSPPLPPRTLRTNLYPTKNNWEQFIEKPVCNNDKVKCNCNRPSSCPAEEGSPPIPPKYNAQDHKSKCRVNSHHNDKLSSGQNHIAETGLAEANRVSRKQSRHNSSDSGKARKKSRSKSKTLPNDQNVDRMHQYEGQRYFMKTHDNLIDKNCEIFYKTNDLPDANLKLCKISESNETSVKFYPKPTEVTRDIVPQLTHPPDLIPDRCCTTKVTQSSTTSTDEHLPKCGSKFRMKSIFNFWSKHKKVNDLNRVTTTPDESALAETENLLSKPRRSKSLHLIPGLSPTAVHGDAKMVSPEIKTNSSSIFAVISPTTTRSKRNFLCISPKANNPHKKPTSASITTNNSKMMLPEKPQQRPGLSSLTGVRISPVHLMACSAEKCGADKDINLNFHHYNEFHQSCNNGELCKFNKFRSDHQERGNFKEMDALNKASSGSKVHTHHDASQRKTPQHSNQGNRQLAVNNPSNTLCSCYNNYRCADNHCSNNSAYHHFCQAQSVAPPCYMHNIIQFNPNHFHCCHGNHQLWCIVPCCSEKIKMKQPPFCSCHIYHQTTSSPVNLSRHLPPPPPPPPPVLSFSNSHQFPRRYRHSYSKTPPPSFHTHQISCHDDHCYQEYNLSQMNDSRQKLIISNHIKSNTFHSNCCRGFQTPCFSHNQSKCSACGSLIYDEVENRVTHYSFNEKNNCQCSNSSMLDASCDQKFMPQGRMFASTANPEESFNCHCLYNQGIHQHSETCDRPTNEMRSHGCINHRTLNQPYGFSDKERSSSKHRKNSSHSCHGSNLDTEGDEKHELSKTHHNSPAANILTSTSIHISPETNANNGANDMSTSLNNGTNISNSISNMTASSSTMIQSNRKQQHFEPWRKTFHDNMMALRNLGWYWGPLNHLEAENLVQGRPDGTFLVRDSGNEAYFLSLTFRVLGTTYHTRIEYSQGKFSFWSQPESHSATTIVEFIDKAVAHSVSGKFHYFLQTSTPGQPPMEVSLLYPLSRYQIVQSLQHLSRFVILSNIRRDHVSHLDLPQSIKSYLMEKQYYIDCIETFVSVTKDSEPLTYEPSGSVILTL